MITKCTNDDCHMKAICKRMTAEEKPFQSYGFFEPELDDCDNFVIDTSTQYSIAEVQMIKEKVGRFDTRTGSLL